MVRASSPDPLSHAPERPDVVRPPSPGRAVRALAWVVVAVCFLALSAAYLAATYTHEEASAFESALVQWGQLVLASAAFAAAVAAARARTRRRALSLAGGALLLAAAWFAVIDAALSAS